MNTTFIKDKTLPRLFMMQWMKYVLDNCASIAHILGKPVIHTIEDMPVPVLGYTFYADEIERL